MDKVLFRFLTKPMKAVIKERNGEKFVEFSSINNNQVIGSFLIEDEKEVFEKLTGRKFPLKE